MIISDVHCLITLSAGENVRTRRLRDLAAGNPWCCAVTQRINIESSFGAYTASATASVAEEHSNGIFRMAGLNPDREIERLAVQLNLDHVLTLDLHLLRHLR